MPAVGGDPTEISSGGSQLSARAHDLQRASHDATTAGGAIEGAAGEPALAESVRRLAAALAASVHDTGVQARAAGELATHAAGDLDRATGGP